MNKILFCLMALPVVLQSQVTNNGFSTFAITDSTPCFGWVLDSVKWVVHDTVFSAKRQCKHLWVFRSDSSTSLHGGFLTDVSKQNEPPFWQQEKSDETWFYNNRSRICRACLTEVAEHLVKYWRYVPPTKNEFELLKEKQKTLRNKR